MGIFKNRNFALACFGYLVTLYASHLLESTLLCLLAALFPLIIVIGIISYFVFKRRFIKNALIKYTPLCLFITLAILASLLVFKRDISQSNYYCDGNEDTAYMEIYEVRYLQDDMGIYLADVTEINNEAVRLRTLMFTLDRELDVGDCSVANGLFSPLEQRSMGFSEKDTYLEYGVNVSFDCTSYKYLHTNENKLLSFFKGINSFLAVRYENNTNSTTSPILSALFLGNRQDLSDDVTRDFSRIGISHILSLSGMHLAILVGVLEVLLNRIRFSKLGNYVVLTSCVLFYIMLTGFALSCLRAGLMIVLVYTLEMLFTHLNRLTSLFVSVFLICLLSPYSIFSSSLQLSFLAMLGCFIAGRLVYKGNLRYLKGRGKRYIIFTLIISCFITFCTLPVICSSFGVVTLLSPLANLILVPIFSVLIYLAPLVLLVCDIPYLSDVVIFITERLTDLALFIVSRLADMERTLLPIRNMIQIFGVIVISASIIGMLFLSKKHLKRLVISALAGALIIFIGSTYLFIERGNNSYAGVYSFTGNDLIFYEENNTLSIIDITKCTITSASRSRNLASYLGYGEVENYIITSYTESTTPYFKRLINQIKIKSIYLPTPTTDEELTLYCQLIQLARNEGIQPMELKNELFIQSAQISLEIKTQERSIKKAPVCFCRAETDILLISVADAMKRQVFFHMKAQAFPTF